MALVEILGYQRAEGDIENIKNYKKGHDNVEWDKYCPHCNQNLTQHGPCPCCDVPSERGIK